MTCLIFQVICTKSLDSSDASDMQQSTPRLAAYFMALASGPMALVLAVRVCPRLPRWRHGMRLRASRYDCFINELVDPLRGAGNVYDLAWTPVVRVVRQ